MKKFLVAAILGLVLSTAPDMASAAPPGFYSGGTFVSAPSVGFMPFAYGVPYMTGPTVSGFNYYTSPYGYRTFNSFSYTPTPWGPVGYQRQATSVRPYVMAPYHSVYWNPFLNTYQYGPGYKNAGVYGFGW